MTPNPKHIEIINLITGNDFTIKYMDDVTARECLACMQVLQDEIDDLKAQNKELREQLKTM